MRKISPPLLTFILLLTLNLNAQKFTHSTVVNTTAPTDSQGDNAPCLIERSNGDLYCVWYSKENLQESGTDEDIFYSENDGSGWSEPAFLNTNAITDHGSDYYPIVIERNNGDLFCIWYSDEDLNGLAGTDADIFYATDSGSGWSNPAILNSIMNSDDYLDYRPYIIEDSNGFLWCVYFSRILIGGGSLTDADIYYSKNNGTGWSNPSLLNTNGYTDVGEDLLPRLIEDNDGNIYCCWYSNEDLNGVAGTDYDIFYSKYSVSSWSTPAFINTNGDSDIGNDLLPMMAKTSNGTIYCVWVSYENLGGTIGTDQDILYAYNNGSGWSEPAILNMNASSDIGADSNPFMAVDSSDNLHCIWYSTEDYNGTGVDKDLFYANYNGSVWLYPILFNHHSIGDSGTDDNAWLIIDSTDILHCVWRSTDDLSGTIGNDDDILYQTILGPYLVIDYGAAYGLFEYEDGVHRKISTLSPEDMLAADVDGDGEDELVLDYDVTNGLHIYDLGISTQINSTSPIKMIAANMDTDAAEELVIDFGNPQFIQEYNEGIWTQINGASCELMIAADIDGDKKDNIIIDYGQTYGIFDYEDGIHTRINTVSPESFIAGNLDSDYAKELIIDYGTNGLFKYDNGIHTQLNTINPLNMNVCDIDGDNIDEIYINFGSAYGLWEYNGGIWTKINTIQPENFLSIDFNYDKFEELLIDYGSYGLYIFDGISHTQINTVNPEGMIRANIDKILGDEAIIDYGSFGIWQYDGVSHTKINKVNPELFIAVDNYQKYY